MQTTYTLVIDEDRDTALTIMFNYLESCGLHDLMHVLQDDGLAGVFTELISVKSDKSHLLDWCKDPDCEQKKA